jgi:hypothetical protein
MHLTVMRYWVKNCSEPSQILKERRDAVALWSSYSFKPFGNVLLGVLACFGARSQDILAYRRGETKGKLWTPTGCSLLQPRWWLR